MKRAPHLAAMLFALVLGCSGAAPKPPPPAVGRASAELQALRVYVFKGETPPRTPEDEYEYKNTPGLTMYLREAVQRALAGAGYVVVLDRRAPHDLVARVHASWPLEGSGVATMTLDAEGGTVGQMSAVVPSFERYEHLYDHAAVELVDKMTRTPRLAEHVGRPRRPVEQKVAAPPAPSP